MIQIVIKPVLVIALLILPQGAFAERSESTSNISQRFVFLMGGASDASFELIRKAAQFGYTGVVVANSVFGKMESLSKQEMEKLQAFRLKCKTLGLEYIACVQGMANGALLHSPDLAEALPVFDAPFRVQDGKLVPRDDGTRIDNGSFEQDFRPLPAGWTFSKEGKKCCSVDTVFAKDGKVSLRVEHRHEGSEHAKFGQFINVKTFHYYHLRAYVRTKGFTDGSIRIEISSNQVDGQSFYLYTISRVKPTQDWDAIDITFNSLGSHRVSINFITSGPEGGTVWFDNVQIEPAGLVNVVRRENTPLAVLSEDQKTTYLEGKDFALLKDPRMKPESFSRYTYWHELPAYHVMDAGGLREKQIVRLSYFHVALMGTGNATACLSEPGFYTIARWQVKLMKKYLSPDGYFMPHDEIRCQGWDLSCQQRGLTCGEILADNVKKCTEIIREIDPGKTIYIWSDMFDPSHNAKPNVYYYLVKGKGGWYGSWKGLDKDIIVVNWPDNKDMDQSMRFFSRLGNRQILAGYYDYDRDARLIADWIKRAQGIPGITGVMYTTWKYHYDDLDLFSKAISK